MFSNEAADSDNDHKSLKLKVSTAADSVGERVWPMPIFKEHSAELKNVAKGSDLRSTGKGREGGACTAAAFLKEFVCPETPWIHLDIAGPAMYSEPRGCMPAGGTGFGAQLLLEVIDNSKCK